MKSLGEIAYEAYYGFKEEGMTVVATPWASLYPALKARWEAAADAVTGALLKDAKLPSARVE
jgi:hypothetical protein